MSSTLYIYPESSIAPLTLGEITEEMRLIGQRNKEWLKQAELSLNFRPMVSVGDRKYEEAALALSLSLDQPYTWSLPDLVPGAVLASLFDFFPLEGELEIFRKQKGLSFYYTVDLSGAASTRDKNLWRLTASAIANLARGLTNFDSVWESSRLHIVESVTVEQILI